ncbi:Hemoglobin-like flavoprotein [Gemmobacter aquatilis]|uniref:Hemoglobin-like flavoprotein n=1 Tax=Gemmobacter aquatilis TaxID=933059 RepID=A0A1H8A3Z1_9RHOB|nr:globin domain-containing protein [Gemmobacter aquatilis]SEM65226.1 Hemoglobin-like flavoprotein [Gemmobacter aquatilis]
MTPNLITPDQISLVRSHVALLKGQEHAFAAAFYDRLFAIAPQVRPMFPADLADQGRKLMTVLAFAAATLDRPEALAPAARSLGARHVAYGVTADHFAPVAEALLISLAGWLRAGFTDAALEAWQAAITALAGLMAEGMASVKAAA